MEQERPGGGGRDEAIASSVQVQCLFMDTATNAFPPSGARTGWTDGEDTERLAGGAAAR